MNATYVKLDLLIKAALAAGPRHCTQLWEGAVKDECLFIAKHYDRIILLPELVLDLRLQALRRAGQIRYSGQKRGAGWEIVHESTGQ